MSISITKLVFILTFLHRTAGFFCVSLGVAVGGISGPVISSVTMQASSPWIPIVIASMLLPFVYLAALFLPETRKNKISPSLAPRTISNSMLDYSRTHVARSLNMLSDRSVAILLVIGFISRSIQMAQGQILAQTISKRFSWTLAQTGYLFSGQGILVILILASLSAISASSLPEKWVPRQWNNSSAFSRNLTYTRISYILLAVGSLMLGNHALWVVITGLMISTLTAGLPPVIKALIAAYVSTEESSTLYALIAMLDTAGLLFAAPSLAWMFATGVKQGGEWEGLPFYWAAFLSASIVAALHFLRSLPHGDIVL